MNTREQEAREWYMKRMHAQPDPELREYTVILQHDEVDMDDTWVHVTAVQPWKAIELAKDQDFATWSDPDPEDRARYHVIACILGHHQNLAP